eukprot:m.352540 g.352540  ORF g.352540 m.352540 type:complete len:143 (+) comp20710_c0_seq9:2206-2634(+)
MTVAPIDAFNCTAAEGTDATTAAAGTNDLGTYPPNATPYGIVNLSPVYRKQGGPEPPQPPIASVKRGFAAVQKYGACIHALCHLFVRSAYCSWRQRSRMPLALRRVWFGSVRVQKLVRTTQCNYRSKQPTCLLSCNEHVSCS